MKADTPNWDHLRDLNPQQLSAVRHARGPVLILAGAGSGKTRVLTRRVVNLVLEHRAPPSSILAVTFTNKAAQEMRERLDKLLGSKAAQLWVSTFHSAGLRILRRHATKLDYLNDFVVYDDQDVRGVLRAVIRELGIDEKRHTPGEFSRVIDRAKNNGITPENYTAQYDDSLLFSLNREIYENYQSKLRSANAMDFGDLILNPLLLFQQHTKLLTQYQNDLQYILVDEFQDTNLVQYQLVRLLAEPKRNLLVVGDDDQSIYAFRGATVRNILDFERDFPGAACFKLEQNYRSTPNILNAANAIISHNTERKEKKLWTENVSGSAPTLKALRDEQEEAQYVVEEIAQLASNGCALKEIAIFYRTHAQSRALEEAFIAAGIAYRIFGGLKFYDRKEIKDIIAYLRLIANARDDQAFMRIINTPARGIGAQTLQAITAQSERGYFESAKRLASARSSRAKAIAEFVTLIESLRARASTLSLSDLIRAILKETDYTERFSTNDQQSIDTRKENLQELTAIASSIEVHAESTAEALQLFLDRVALTSGGDQASAGDSDSNEAVTLMTFHLAKGLEFRVVFMVGFEDGLLPHYRTLQDPIEISEERRLCYVGITRAREQLYITRAERRGMFSAGEGFAATGGFREVSRFGYELPEDLLEHARSGGEDFLLGGQTFSHIEEKLYEFDDDDDIILDPDGATLRKIGNKKVRQPSVLERSATLAPKLGSADQLNSNNAANAALAAQLPRVQIKQLTTGLKVVHPSYGIGVVAEIHGELDGSPRKLRVDVRFKEFVETKRLIFEFAKLSLAEGA